MRVDGETGDLEDVRPGRREVRQPEEADEPALDIARLGDEHVARARLIFLCQRAGLSLDQIKQLIVADTADRAARLREHRAAIAGRIDELRRADAFLEHTLTCAHPVVTQCPECSGFASGRDLTAAARPFR